MEYVWHASWFSAIVAFCVVHFPMICTNASSKKKKKKKTLIPAFFFFFFMEILFIECE